MSTPSTTTVRPITTTPFSHITRVIKLHLVNPWQVIVLPWIVIAGIFVLSYGIWLTVYASVAHHDRGDVAQGLQYSGSSTWIFVYMMVVAVQAMTLTFPLALGYGSTRRNFYLGSAATFLLLSLMWSVGLTILSALETATNGWGVGGRMFSVLYFGGSETSIPERFVIFLSITLFFYFVGAAVAGVWVRWKATGLTLFFLALGVLVVGAIALLTLTDSWGAVGEFFATSQAFGTALWLLIPTAIAGIAGYFVLRRATPRS